MVWTQAPPRRCHPWVAAARVPAPSPVLTPALAARLTSPPGITRCIFLSARCHCYFRPRLPLLKSATRFPRFLRILVLSTLPSAGNCWPRTPHSLLLPCSCRLLTPSLFQVTTSNRKPNQGFLWSRGCASLEAGVLVVALFLLDLPHQDDERQERQAGVGTGPGGARRGPGATCHWTPASGTLHGCPLAASSGSLLAAHFLSLGTGFRDLHRPP